MASSVAYNIQEAQPWRDPLYQRECFVRIVQVNYLYFICLSVDDLVELVVASYICYICQHQRNWPSVTHVVATKTVFGNGRTVWEQWSKTRMLHRSCAALPVSDLQSIPACWYSDGRCCIAFFSDLPVILGQKDAGGRFNRREKNHPSWKSHSCRWVCWHISSLSFDSLCTAVNHISKSVVAFLASGIWLGNHERIHKYSRLYAPIPRPAATISIQAIPNKHKINIE